MKPADLRPGHRLPTPDGIAVVLTHAVSEYDAILDRNLVRVDVDDSRTTTGGEARLDALIDHLRAIVAQNMDDSEWRRRLYFHPDTDVTVEDP